MSGRVRRAAAVLAPVLIVTGTCAVLATRPARTAPLAVAAPAGPCGLPTFTVAYQREDGGVRPLGAGFRLQGVSVLSAVVCGPGTLVLDADGDTAQGAGPRLDVALDGQVLATPSFTARRTVRVAVPRAGRLSVAYLNDVYVADVRIVDLTQVELTPRSDTACAPPGFGTDVLQGVGARWADDRRTGTLTWTGPLALRPCAAGTLFFRVRGRAARGEAPRVTFTQSGRTVAQFTAGPTPRGVSIPVSAAPVLVTLDNPLNQTVQDRNATVYALSFDPRP